MKCMLGNFLVTISILLHLAGSSVLHQTPWTSSREVSCSWDDRGFLVDGKPFVFTKEEIATSLHQQGSTAGVSGSRNSRKRSILTKDAHNDDGDDEIVDDGQGGGPDDASKTVDEVVTEEGNEPAVDDDTHSSTHDDDNDDDGGADDDNDDDKEDEENTDVEIVSSSGTPPSKPLKKPSSSSRVHNNAAAIAEVKALWRDVISGAREGCLDVGSTAGSTITSSSSSSTVLSVVPGSGEGMSSPTQLSTVSVHVKSSSAGDAGYDAVVALRANGTDRTSFLRQMEAQFMDPLATAITDSTTATSSSSSSSSVRRALWLDRDLVLSLKGSAVLAQHPHLLITPPATAGSSAGTTSSSRSRSGITPSAVLRYSPSRGVRLESPSSSYSMQQAVVQALTRALGCSAVSLNRRNIDLVRAKARALSVPRHLLSTANLLSSLLDEIEEQDRPALLALDDDLSWLLGSQATSEVLLEELKNTASRAFFVMLSPEAHAREQLKVGMSAAALRAQRQQPMGSTQQQSQANPGNANHMQQQGGGGLPNFANMFSGGNPSFPFAHGRPPSPSLGGTSSNEGDGEAADAPPDAETHPSSDPHQPQQGASMPSPGVVFGRSFQVTIQNGSATLSPIPNMQEDEHAGHAMAAFAAMQQGQGQGMPFPLPPGVIFGGGPPGSMSMPFPGPGQGGFGFGGGVPPEVMQRIMMEQQRMMQQQQQQQQGDGSAPNQQQQLPVPPFPPHLTEEELHDFLANPDNQPAVKEFLDKVMGMVMSQLPPGMSLEMGPDGQPVMPLGPNGETPRVEVKVHMVQVPAHLGHPLAHMQNNHPNMYGGGGFGGVPMGLFPFPLHMGHPGAPPPAAATPSSSAVDKKKKNKDKDKKTRTKDKEGEDEGDADWEDEELDLDAEEEGENKDTGTTKDKEMDAKKGEKDRGMPGLGFFKRMTQGSGSSSKADKDTPKGRVASRTNGSGKRKGSSGGSRQETGVSKAAGKIDRDLDLEDDHDDSSGNGRSDPYNDERRPGETSPGGKALLGLFEVLGVEAPRDQGLRGLWERMADEEACDRIARANRRALARELRRLGLWSSSTTTAATATTTGASLTGADSESAVKKAKGKGGLGRVLRGLDDLLQRQVLSDEEVRRAVAAAVRLQAGTFDALRYANAAAAAAAQATVTILDTTKKQLQPQQDKSSDAPAQDDALTAAVNGTMSSKPLSPSSTSTSSSKARPRPAIRLRLSLWALDSALSQTMATLSATGSNKNNNPNGQQPIGPGPAKAGTSYSGLGVASAALRTKEEISAMVTDKHERALIPNVILPQEIGVTYDMIGGLGDVKEVLRQCVTYPLKYPRLYQEGVAQEAVKGVLLFGPPGTGKTMLAKAVATEGGATFLTVDASTIENKWLGESEKNAKAVFTLARRLAPCVVYLDEVDSVLSSREHGDDSSHGTLTSVKTTLMQEWDGLRTTKDRVVVIASTNRPFDLDEAVLRRLPRRIMVDLPDLITRRDIMAVTLAGNRLGPDVNLTRVAEALEGYTGSDIKEVCREAVVRVAHERARQLEAGHGLSHLPLTDMATADSSGRRRKGSLTRKVAALASGSSGDVDGDAVGAEAVEVDENEEEEEEIAFGFFDSLSSDGDPSSTMGEPDPLSAASVVSSSHALRPVSAQDFKEAIKKLKASVDEGGRELQKVQEWNDKYGEVKQRKGASKLKAGTHMSLYI